jgi:CubicO group peptidase (beta-lactamase class C family)
VRLKIFFLLFFFSVWNSYGQIRSLNELDNRIEYILDNIQKGFRFPGFAMTIVRDTSTIFEKTYGLKRIEQNSLINSNTQFYWASVSKVFTATAIMKLYEEGKLQLDDPVIKYYPEFMTTKGIYSSDSITIRHLLTHTSGLRKNLDDNLFMTDERSALSAREGLKDLKTIKLLFKPGTNKEYSNIGIVVLGVLIENISGMPFELYMKQNILDPIGMKNSSFFETNTLTDTSIAGPHYWKRKQLISLKKRLYKNIVNSAGGLRASIQDMAKWMKVNIQTGIEGKEILLKSETMEHMLKDSLRIKNSEKDINIKGLTWDCKEYEGHPVFAKGGNLGGMSGSYIIIFEDLHLGIALATNFDFNEWDSTMGSIIDLVLEYEEGLNNSK